MQKFSTVVKDRVGAVYVPSSVVEERKIELLDNLSIAVEKIQNEFDNPLHNKLVTDGKTTKYLCNCLEDIFQHGLREKLFQGSAISPDKLSFWAVIQKLSMKEDIQTIYRLSIIQTDTNRCRAWIKMKLTDHTIGSYIGLLTDDSKLLREFYGSTAFLRDSVKVESVKTLLQYVIANLDFQINVEENEGPRKTPSPSNTDSPAPVIGSPLLVETLSGDPIRRRRSSKKKAKTPTSNIAHIKDFETASYLSGRSSQHSSRRSSISSQSSVHSSSGYQRTLSVDSYVVDKTRRSSQPRIEKHPRSESKSVSEPVAHKDTSVKRAVPYNRPISLDLPQTVASRNFDKTSEESHIQRITGPDTRLLQPEKGEFNAVIDSSGSLDATRTGVFESSETSSQSPSIETATGRVSRLLQAEKRASIAIYNEYDSLDVAQTGAPQRSSAISGDLIDTEQLNVQGPRLSLVEAGVSNAVSCRTDSLNAVQTGLSDRTATRKESRNDQNRAEIKRIIMDFQASTNRPLPVEKILELLPQKDGLNETELKRYLDECIADYFSLGIITNKAAFSKQRNGNSNHAQSISHKDGGLGIVTSNDKSNMAAKNEKYDSRTRTDSGRSLHLHMEPIILTKNDSLNGIQNIIDKPLNDGRLVAVNEADKPDIVSAKYADSRQSATEAESDNFVTENMKTSKTDENVNIDVKDASSAMERSRRKNFTEEFASAESINSSVIANSNANKTRNGSLLEDSILSEIVDTTITNETDVKEPSTQTNLASEFDSPNPENEANAKESLSQADMTPDSDFNFVPGIYEEPRTHSRTKPIQSKRANTIAGFGATSSRSSSTNCPSRSLGNEAVVRSKQKSSGSSDTQDLLYGFRMNSPSLDSPHSSLNTTQAMMFDDENCISDSETNTYDSTETDEKERIRSILADLGVNDDIVGLKEDHFATPDGFMGFTTSEELQNAIETCKEKVKSLPNNSEDRKQLVRKLVQLRLKLHEQKEAPSEGLLHVKKILGHQFAKQGKPSGNYFCDCCGSTIWALMHTLYKCIACSFYCHKKCLSVVDKPCVSKKVSGSMYITDIAPECGMSTQQYRCADCRRRLLFRDGYFQARLCDYTGQFYCSNCHWNESQVIPARVIHNWDFLPRKISRQSKHLLNLLSTKPIICLKELNSALFNFVEDLRDVKALREQILSMKSYLISCRLAVEEKMLLLLKDRQHFVENSDMYTLQDLIGVYSGELLEELSRIQATFCKHINFDCILCQGKGFICEICRSGDVIYPFDFSSQECPNCKAVFHRACLRRGNCPKCIRMAQRKELR